MFLQLRIYKPIFWYECTFLTLNFVRTTVHNVYIEKYFDGVKRRCRLIIIYSIEIIQLLLIQRLKQASFYCL